MRRCPSLLTAQRVIELVQLARQRNVGEGPLLQSRLDDLIESAALQGPGITVLQRPRVISHGDLAHKHVL